MRMFNRKSVFILLTLLLGLLASQIPVAAQSWSNGYARRRTITVDHTKVPNTDEANFPVLISGTYSYLATAGNGGNVTNANGYDIIFTSDAAGTTALSYERESYNPTTGASTFWVKIPTLSHTTNTVLYMFYGNSSVTTDQSNKTSVWDSSFALVYHLSDNAANTTVSDSTANANTGTNLANTNTKTTSGQISNALSYAKANNDTTTIQDSASLEITGAVSFSAWINTTDGNSTNLLRSYQNGGGYNGYGIGYGISGVGKMSYWSSAHGSWVVSNSSLNDGAWHYVVVTVSSGGTVSFYRDGVADGTQGSNVPASYTGTRAIGDAGFTGALDEVHISNIARSADWVSTSYNNQSQPSTFLTVGSDDSSGPNITSLSATSGLIGASITISGTNFGSTQGSSTVTVNGTTATATSWSATSIAVTVPSGASSGNVVVTVSGIPSNGIKFRVTSGYSYFRTITIDHTKVPNTDQINFPVLISGTYSYLATTANGGNVTNANGYDIIFSPDSAGTSILDFEQESYAPSTGAINCWVRVPTVSHTSDTVIYVFYGNSSVTTDQSNKTGVWDSNYKGVWHLPNGTTLTANDSTTNGNSGIISGAAATTGEIGGGASFNGSSKITIVTTGSSLSGPFTIEVWAKPANLNSGLGLFGSRSPSDQGFDATLTGSGVHGDIGSGSSWLTTSADASLSYSANTWHHFVYAVTTSDYKIYGDGSQIGSGTISGTPLLYDANHTLTIGQAYPGQFFNGVMDETRVSNVARSANWIATEYNNQGASSTFYSIGSAGSGSAGSPRITSLSPTSGPAGTSVTITGTSFGSTQGSSTVTFNGTAATATSWSTSQVVASVPSGATNGNVVVSVSSVASNGVIFAIAPSITSLSPPSGAIGSSITITGNAFGATQGSSTVTFNGVSASPTSWSATSIVVPVPAGATTGNVVVTVGGLASVGVSFGLAPGITNLSPTSGVVSTSVTITGTTFGATQGTSTVTFNGTLTTPTSWSATSIVVPVPVGATTGNVVVTVGGLASNGATFTVTLGIASLSPTGGVPGTPVTITGTGFGATQGSSTVTFNGTQAIPTSWSNTSIVVPVPNGAMTGNVVVTLASVASNGLLFTPLPSGWLDQDIGSVGLAGTAGYSDGTFTVMGAGGGVWSTPDAFHFAYRSLSGDGTILARLVSTQLVSAESSGAVGVMIRESLASGATRADEDYANNGVGYFYFFLANRATTGGSVSDQVGSSVPTFQPYWIKLVRSGNTFTGYTSLNAVDWTQTGTSVTVSMATNVDVGLVVTSGWTTTVATATFDNVSVNSVAAPAPVISSVSTTTGSIGGQVTLTGSHFGASQGSSLVTLNGVPMTINSWSDTSITITIASGADTGYLVVSVGPSMNDSNPISFTVTTQPLPSGWFDQDIGTPGATGSAGYASGTFTVKGAGNIGSTADAFHFVYQPLSGDGTIVARIASLQTSQPYPEIGVMVRETLTAGASQVGEDYANNGTGNYYFPMIDRSSTGANTSVQSGPYNLALPYWVKLTRSGNTFTGYTSPDGVYWTQVGTSLSVTMAQSVYIGLAVTSGTSGVLATVTFDNVAITAGTPYPTPTITSISPTSGGIGASITIAGSNFGATQGSSSVRFNGSPTTSITSWSATQIVALVPSTASTGPLTAIVNGIGSNQNYAFTFYNPVISSLSPPAGPIGGSVTLNGSGFGASQGSGTVKFNGLTASISSWSDTSVTATVPSGTTSGPVTVTVGGVTSSGVQFTVIEAISITGIAPSSGPIGTSVVITGTGFGSTQSNSTVNFYGAAATTITSWSDTSITAAVPAGAVTGPVSVTVAHNTATGPVFFLTFTVTLTDSLGHTTTYASEIVGGQWMSTDTQGSGCSTCTSRGVIHNTYDSLSNILTTTDPAGHTTTNTYDSANNLLSTSTPLDGTHTATTSYTYNSFGEVLTVTDPLGNVTTNTYDAHGNLLTVTSPAPNGNTAASVTHFAYDPKGELTSITDPLNHVTTMTYTTAGLVATIKDAQNNVTTYGYDAHGNRTSVTDALNHATTFTYDAGDRLTKITYPDSTTSQFAYDSRGRRTSVTDQNSKVTTYAYDDEDRLTTVTDAASHATTYAYDTESNLTSITDANSHATQFTYDAFGRVTQTNFPSTLSENYAYDADNNLTSKIDRKNQTITYVYDALDRLSKKQYTDSTEVDYVYDLVGKIQSVNDPTGTYAFAYDNMGRLTGTTTSYSFLTGRNFTNAYTYDAASNRTGFTDPESGSTTYSYDTLNRLTSLAPPSAFGSGSFGFSYDALSRRTQMTRPNSVATNYAYDNLSRLTSVLHQLSGSTIDGATYTLDSAGNRTARTDQRAAVTSNYTYDAIYQLTQTMQGSTTTESYTYDPVGNRTASLGVASYTTNASNELTAIPGVTYTYDSDGNTLTKTVGSNTTSYTWDYENRLTSVTLPGSGGTVNFKYDPYGRRIYKSSASSTSIFTYDDDRLIEETTASGGSVARYSQTESIDEPLAMMRGGVTSFYNADGLGSITSLSNSAGTLAQTYSLDSFGKLTASAGSVTNPFLYTAREFDTETNLYFYRARYYDPTVGRFVSQDEIGNDDDADLYRYVRNNAPNLRDPTGLYKLVGFPPGLQARMKTAIRLAIITIITKNCGGCAGADGPKIVGALAKATFVYKPDLSTCGATYHGANRRIEVGLFAFDSGRCCDLASTLAHEADHYGANATDNDQPGSTYDMEKKCFNCGTGHPPPPRP